MKMFALVVRATLAYAAIIFLASRLYAAPDTAQTFEQKNQRFNQLYSQMLNNPKDVDVTLEYTNVAIDLGDYEAAIPPMERLLMSNPSTPKIQLDLGVLYQLLGSKDIARGYFEEVVRSSQASDDQVKQAEEYLAEL